MEPPKKVEGRRGVYAIHRDGELWREVHGSIFGYPPKLPEDLSKLPEIEFKGAKRCLVRLLARRDLCTGQALKKLRDRLVTKKRAEEVVYYFVEQGYIDDWKWAEGRIRALLRKKKGAHFIRQQLRKDGLPEEVIEESVANISQDSEREAVQRLLKTRYARVNLADPRAKQRLLAALQRRGFTLSWRQLAELLPPTPSQAEEEGP